MKYKDPNHTSLRTARKLAAGEGGRSVMERDEMTTERKPMSIGWISGIWIVAVPIVAAAIAAVLSGLSYKREQESLSLPDQMQAIFLTVLLLACLIGSFIVVAVVLRRKNTDNAPNI